MKAPSNESNVLVFHASIASGMSTKQTAAVCALHWHTYKDEEVASIAMDDEPGFMITL